MRSSCHSCRLVAGGVEITCADAVGFRRQLGYRVRPHWFGPHSSRRALASAPRPCLRAPASPQWRLARCLRLRRRQLPGQRNSSRWEAYRSPNGALGPMFVLSVGVMRHLCAGRKNSPVPTSLDNGIRSPRKVLRAIVAGLLGRRALAKSPMTPSATKLGSAPRFPRSTPFKTRSLMRRVGSTLASGST